MADAKKCDGCGIISPDINGAYIANKWVTITIENDRRFPDKYMYCLDCWPRPSGTKTILAKLKQLFVKKGSVDGN